MRAREPVGPWVVFQMNLNGKLQTGHSVCRQSEWDEWQRTMPGQHILIQADIATEEEAEKLARGTSGDALGQRRPRSARPLPNPNPQGAA